MNFWINKIKLDLLLRHLGPFLFGFFSLMFLLLMQFLILHIDKLVGKDIPFLVILELIATNLASMVVLAAPMAVLLATLMAFGKFSELNELTALRASGINPISIIQPVLIAGILFSAGLIWFSNNVLPEANAKARSLFMDIRLKKPGFELKPNIFYNGIDAYTFLVKHIDNTTDSLYNITLFQEPGNTRKRAFIRAKRGFLVSEGEEGLTLFLEEGEILRYLDRNRITGTENQEITTFGKYRITFDLSELAFSRSTPNRNAKSDRSMSAQAMRAVVDTLEMEIDSYTQTASQHISFRQLYGTGSRTPFIKSSELDLAPLSEEQTTTDSLTPPSTTFFTLRYIPDVIYKKRILDMARSSFQQDLTFFENTTTNTDWRTRRINKYLVEIHKKYSIPIACVVFILLGAPLGMMTRKGNFGVAALISSVILTIYWVSIIQGEKLADRLYITPFVGMWSFNIVFSLIGIGLILHLSSELRITNLFRRDD